MAPEPTANGREAAVGAQDRGRDHFGLVPKGGRCAVPEYNSRVLGTKDF